MFVVVPLFYTMFVLYTYELELVLIIIDLCLSQTDNQQKFHPNMHSLSNFSLYLCVSISVDHFRSSQTDIQSEFIVAIKLIEN